ncbi:MAG TPA: glycosyltransferase [Candidatus Paceibacterota bacterium]|nr:glycosyltransferase [Candidatus Paceibacterota bacterium]
MHEISTTLTFVVLFFTLYFEVFLLFTFIQDRKAFRTSEPEKVPRNPLDDAKLPTATIIVPAWNEENTLSGTVRSLLSLDYPREKLSIVIVNDGSTDNTLTVAREFLSEPCIRVIDKENGGKHTAMNLAIENAHSDLIGCLDADSFVDSAALREIVPYFQDPEVMAVTPSVQIHAPDNPLRRMQAAEYMMGQFTRKVFSRIGGLYVTPGPFSIYRRSVFEKIGGFVHGYGTEDMEMAMRMQSHRMKIENAHTALVWTVSPETPYALYRQRVRWVTGFLKNAFYQYRFMLFSPKYGNLGMLTLPFAFISIFFAIYFTSQYLRTIGKAAAETIERYLAIGFDLGFPHFDWFALNVEASRILIYMMLAMTIGFLFAGSLMVTRTLRPTINMLYFILLYGLIAPFWLVRSLYNLITAREARWR